VWVGTANGLMRFRNDGAGWRGHAVGARWDIRSLVRDASGRAVAHTDHGFRRLVNGRLVDAIPTAASVPVSGEGTQPIVDAIFEAGDGTTWAGGPDGLSRIRDGVVAHLGEPDGLPAQRVAVFQV
jgi:ligand-binding sensor domain-containing protein